MPAKYSLKTYKENGYYHIYNRGVEKRLIFLDNQDYSVYLKYLKDYLSPRDTPTLLNKLSYLPDDYKAREKILRTIKLNNFAKNIKLLAYCLMPNHFHLLIYQSDAYDIDMFINSINTRYVMYFNKRYKRVGPLFQGAYKAVSIESDEQLLLLSAYIHTNPVKSKHKTDYYLKHILRQPTSLQYYINGINAPWINTSIISSFFGKSNKKIYQKQLSYSDYLHNYYINNHKPDTNILMEK